MCGIAGFFPNSGSDADRRLLKSMCDSIRHRGPDDEGFYFNPPMAMGIRRLSIIDIVRGKQPIHNEDKSIWVVLNGEIYNYVELAATLKRRGHRLYTDSDTETIVHLYEDYGEDCVGHLRGMFAFALWDERRKKLLLARDRVGEKPLFYFYDGKRIVFASEMKSVLQHGGIPTSLDVQAIDAYFSLLYVPTPRTIYEHIKKIPAGHRLVHVGERIIISKYWELSYRPERERSIDNLAEEFRHIFNEAVRIQMRSDVPVGALLSGGIDSSAVVAAMSQATDKPVETFTVVYGDKERLFDESRPAKEIAARFATNHHELRVNPEVIGAIPKIIEGFDEPFADSSMIPNYFISELLRKHVTVALSGLGGDEVSAGYNRHISLLFSRHYQCLPKIVREGVIAKFVERLPDSQRGQRFPERVKQFIEGDRLPLDQRYLSYLTFFAHKDKKNLYSDDLLCQVNSHVASHYESFFHYTPELDLLNRALFVDLKMYLPDDLLTLTDRMSMAHSLEIRVPFLDYVLLEFMAKVPPEYKLKGFSKKHFLKYAFRGILPANIIRRRKQGFSVPLALWFRNDLRHFVEQILSKTRVERTGFLKYEGIRSILDDHFGFKRNNHAQIWALLVFVLWHEAHVAR
jgi:asparagine synthase (glutamine-hydrolysing)